MGLCCCYPCSGSADDSRRLRTTPSPIWPSALRSSSRRGASTQIVLQRSRNSVPVRPQVQGPVHLEALRAVQQILQCCEARCQACNSRDRDKYLRTPLLIYSKQFTAVVQLWSWQQALTSGHNQRDTTGQGGVICVTWFC